MKRGEKFQNAFERGMTYSEIANEFGCSRNTVASSLHNYRNSQNNIEKFNAEQEIKRIDDGEKCYIREDGITQCPTRACTGFGFDNKGNFYGR